MKAPTKAGFFKENSPMLLSRITSYSNRDFTVSPEGPKEKNAQINQSGKSSLANIFENNLSQFQLENSDHELTNLQKSASSNDLDTQLIYENSLPSLTSSPRRDLPKWLSSNLLNMEKSEIDKEYIEKQESTANGNRSRSLNKVKLKNRIIFDSRKSSFSSQNELTDVLLKSNNPSRNTSEIIKNDSKLGGSRLIGLNQPSQAGEDPEVEDLEEKIDNEEEEEEEEEAILNISSKPFSRIGSAKERSLTPIKGSPKKLIGSLIINSVNTAYTKFSPKSGGKALPSVIANNMAKLPQPANRPVLNSDKKPLRLPSAVKKFSDPPRVDANNSIKQQAIQSNTNNFYRKKGPVSQKTQLGKKASTGINFFQQDSEKTQAVNGAPTGNSNQKRQATGQNISSNVENFILLNRFDVKRHRENIKEYLRRAGLPEDKNIFCFNSQDDHIKRALINRGWVENKNVASIFYDFKWVYNDTNDHYSMLNECQFFNHFQGNRVITSKAGLTSTLRSAKSFLDQDSEEFYPRCFDLGSSKETSDFKLEFLRNSIFIILKKLVALFKKKDPKIIAEQKCIYKNPDKLQQAVKSLKKEGFLAERKRFLSSRDKARRKLVAPPDIQLEPLLKRNETLPGYSINISLLSYIFKFTRFFSKQIRSLAEEEVSFDLEKIPTKVADLIFEYSKTDLMNESELSKGKSNINMVWSTPSLSCVGKLYKYYLIIKDHLPQWSMDGTQNIWIIKPAQNSKGSGIHLVDNLADALESGFNMGARIIQKYIEKPLIIDRNCPKNLRNKKFDIRQWVLVKSFSPMKIYSFSTAYLRISSQDFDLLDIKNLYKHLTNYSINKTQYAGSEEESILPLKVLKDLISSEFHKNWEVDVEPNLRSLIITTLKSAVDLVEQRSSSFEVYGFDIMLDEDCKPWLIEVNLSPACAERAEWLTAMLDDMATGLMEIVLPDTYWEKSGQDRTHVWNLIYEEQSEIAAKDNLKLEIEGVRINIKKERQLDRNYFRWMAAVIIQKFTRRHLAINKLKFLRRTRASIIIQKNARTLFAKRSLIFLRRKRASTKLQCMVRCFLARKKLLLLKKERLAIMIQRLHRGNKGRNIYKFLRREKAATRIQCMGRVALSKNRRKERTLYRLKVNRIQLFWRIYFKVLVMKLFKIQKAAKKHLLRKHIAALIYKRKKTIQIQSFLRMILAKKEKIRLRRERAATKIQTRARICFAKKKLRQLKLRKGSLLFLKSINSKKVKISLEKVKSCALKRYKATLVLQGFRKVIRAKKTKIRLRFRGKVIKIQAFIKMAIKRGPFVRYYRKKRAAVIIQKWVRRFLARNKLRRLKAAKRYRLEQQKVHQRQLASLEQNKEVIKAKETEANLKKAAGAKKPLQYNPSKTAGCSVNTNPFKKNEASVSSTSNKVERPRRLSAKTNSQIQAGGAQTSIMKAKDILKQVPDPLIPNEVLKQQARMKKNEMLLKIYSNASSGSKKSQAGGERLVLPTLYEEKRTMIPIGMEEKRYTLTEERKPVSSQGGLNAEMRKKTMGLSKI